MHSVTNSQKDFTPGENRGHIAVVEREQSESTQPLILTLAISGYRSIRDLVLPLDQLTVVTGTNGAGKSSLYRSIRLLSNVARGGAIAALAREGGLESTLWAGPETISRSMKRGDHPIQGTGRKDSVALKLGFADKDHGYAIDLGFPVPGGSFFDLDPEIKHEALWFGEVLGQRNLIANRAGMGVSVMQPDGHMANVINSIPGFESMMTLAADPKNATELIYLRQVMAHWRFYDQLRTDQDSPARRPTIGTRTTSLAGDGSDLAPAIQTIFEIGDDRAFDAAISDAFPGGRVIITNNDGLFELSMQQKGMLRPLKAAELSDGTLRYILLVAALLTPRPPPFLVLNEPETSLHPDLLEPLGRLILEASKSTQVLVVTHAKALVETMRSEQGCLCHELTKDHGETVIAGLERPRWKWPVR